jgi:enoyl-CoA hydratase
VITGAGRAFSSGGDIGWMQLMIDDPARFEKTAREGKQIVFSLLDCEKPIVAKVNGHATGLGATIALFCDVIFASERAKIGDPHVSVGFVAGDGGAVILAAIGRLCTSQGIPDDRRSDDSPPSRGDWSYQSRSGARGA